MRRLLLVTLVVVVGAQSAHGIVPTSITAQGRLTDNAGVPAEAGAKNFTFRIFDDSAAGVKVWPASAGELQSITTTTEGLWIALIGALEPLSDSVFSGAVRWLEIEVDGTLLPRVRLVTGPYAFRVATVDGASGGTITSKVSIGSGHTNIGTDAFVAGYGHTATGNYSTIGGGYQNYALGTDATVGGGLGNAAMGDVSVVAGGLQDTAYASGAAVLGGTSNTAAGLNSSIVGGENNYAQSSHSFVGGGQNNLSEGNWAVVAGGIFNRCNGSFGVVGGGSYDTVNSPGGVVIGGLNNVANGFYSTVLGGQNNRAEQGWSLAAGYRSEADHQGCFVWSDDNPTVFASTGMNQFLVEAEGGMGINTNAPYEDLTLSGTSSIGFKNGTSPMMHIYESGTSNAARPVIVHSPDHTDWGLQYADVGDEMVFQGNGNTALKIELGEREVGVREDAPTSSLDVNGSLALGIATVAASTTLTSGENVLIATASGITLTLPDAVTCPGRLYTIKKEVVGGSISVTTTGGSGDTIDGAGSQVLIDLHSSITIISDGSDDWYIIATN